MVKPQRKVTVLCPSISTAAMSCFPDFCTFVYICNTVRFLAVVFVMAFPGDKNNKFNGLKCGITIMNKCGKWKRFAGEYNYNKQ